ncbi:hypothetical protein SCLCIDRAFT_1210074 [Scleroderma citrinum Foug A]|uniref:Uncharacterized protein n=1 Tax=Scleroderma citrinum Foug A TaxID=1036808 RepID=A0A0C3A2P3_9AGAM|nr:hypothetical protein SCLCIDRAFT_1210074 [Scleroderma citrinum Foug A]
MAGPGHWTRRYWNRGRFVTDSTTGQTLVDAPRNLASRHRSLADPFPFDPDAPSVKANVCSSPLPWQTVHCEDATA